MSETDIFSFSKKLPSILFIYPQPKHFMTSVGLPDPRIRFREVLNMPEEQKFDIVFAADEPIPQTIDYDAYIIGGSIHSVYENLPWMRELQDLVEKIHRAGRPMLGICFGHQIIAAALGGEVERGRAGVELGAVDIVLTEEGAKDPLFRGFSGNFAVGMWHQDAVTQAPTVPGTRILAKNENYSIQALAIGENIRTVQFHPEYTNDVFFNRLKSRDVKKLGEGTSISDDETKRLIRLLEKIDLVPSGEAIIRNFYDNFVFARRPALV